MTEGEIEVRDVEGIQVARVTYNGLVFEELLPHGIETWPKEEWDRILRLTARRLGVKVMRAKQREESGGLIRQRLEEAEAKRLRKSLRLITGGEPCQTQLPLPQPQSPLPVKLPSPLETPEE